MQRVFLSLGANLGERRSTMVGMVKELITVLEPPFALSRLMETEPVGVGELQEWYLNLILSARYRATPQELLDRCLSIERSFGRTRTVRYGARTADIDLLLFGEFKIETASLTIPHPRISTRRFVLEGLCDIDAELTVPGSDLTVGETLKNAPAAVVSQGLRFLDSRDIKALAR
jgi:2-amino-4-hydroxy-6-hydroxymethyldihydropteridine diphosphokinase